MLNAKFVEGINKITVAGLVQWDSGRKLAIELPTLPSKVEIHFAQYTPALVVKPTIEDGIIVASIPDILLQIASKITAWVYVIDEAEHKTIKTIYLPVEARAKPIDYVYTETEKYTLEEAMKEILDKGIETVTPDYNENDPTSKSFIENRPFYDTRETDENGEETGELVTLEDKYLDLANRPEFRTVESIAKGAHQAVSFGNYETMVTALNALPKDTYKIPQSVMIVTLNVPDLWVSAIAEESVPYTYVDDTTLANEIFTNGSVQVGYYVLSALETQKVDLTNYVKNTDYASSSKGGVVKVKRENGFVTDSTGGLYVFTATDPDFEGKKTHLFLRPSNYPLIAKYGLAYNGIANGGVDLTDEEKASAQAWLGISGGKLYKHDVVIKCGDYSFYNEYTYASVSYVSTSAQPITTIQELLDTPACSGGYLRFNYAFYYAYDSADGHRDIDYLAIVPPRITVYYITAYTIPKATSSRRYEASEVVITDTVTEV